MYTKQSFRHHQQYIKRYLSNSDSYCFFNLLTSDSLLNKVEELLPDHRERLYPPTETLSLFLAQAMSADSSCQNVVNQSAVKRISGGMMANSTRTGGYCRARQRLPFAMIKELARYIGDQLQGNLPEQWRWMGRSVKLVDGTTMTMPDTPQNQKTFPQQGGQKPGLGFPICRLVGITCLGSGALLEAAIGRFSGKGSDEQTLLRSLEDNFTEGDILLGDAFFATYFFMASMQAKGVDILMEQHGSRRKSTDFNKGQKLAAQDHLITFNKPKIKPSWMSEEHYQAAPDSITVREFKASGKIMVTTLLCAKTYPKKALKALYASRWNIELDIRHIKDTLGMDVLSCKSPDMVVKEIWVYLLAYNLIRLMMAQSALLADISPRQLSFKHCLQLWAFALTQLTIADKHQSVALLKLMAQQRVGHRPGRVEPRAVKRRPKAFPLLTQPRIKMRDSIREKGHPKKLK